MEILSPKESVEGGDTVLRGSVRASQGFSEGLPEGTLLRGQLFHCAPRILNSCSDYQIHDVYWQIKLFFRQSLRTFPCLSDFGLQKPKKMWPRVAPWACLEKQWVWTCSSLTVLNPDFGGGRTKSESDC